jgi:hypothetical protein
MPIIKQNCLKCQKEFNARSQDINRGYGKFCTQSCASLYARALEPKPEPNVECAFCHTKFYKTTSKKALSKSKLYFCCRAHKDAAQCIGGIKEIMPPHFGTAKADDHSHYRRIAFSNKPKACERCLYDEHPAAIIVHHKDRNRMNDDESNLEILCANCHAIEHWGNT